MRRAIARLEIRLAKKGFKSPRKSIMYFDNCPENKNKLFQAWASLCIELHYLDDIEACYLVTGHTHNNVDQTLGSYSTIIDMQQFISTPAAVRHLLQTHSGTGSLLSLLLLQNCCFCFVEVFLVIPFRRELRPTCCI